MPDHVINSADAPYFPQGAAVVIGGSGGIGQAICERLADHGTDVVLTYRSNREAGEQTAEIVRERGRAAHCVSVDLADAATVDNLFDEAVEQFGAVHTVVFAIGTDIPMVYASAVDPEWWHRTIDADLTGFYNVVKASIPHLRKQGGSIVAISSAGIVRHPPKDVLSTVPKAGIEALMRAIAREEGRFGIRANSVQLGVVEAGHFHRVEEELGPDFIDAMKRNTAIGRLATAREAADATVFLASSAASYITGHSLAVDGGYSV